MSNKLVSCSVEPLPPFGVNYLLRVLQDNGAQDIFSIDPSYISAKIPEDKISAIQEFANVTIKPLKKSYV